MNNKTSLLMLIKASLWEAEPMTITYEEYEEMKLHAILMLPAGVFSKLTMPDQLYNNWRKDILQQIVYLANYRHIESNLPLRVPYVIIKGKAAAQYYPHPEYRTMGDIDIITKREDFDAAYHQMIDDNYTLISENEREVTFKKNGIVIELHRFFASLNDPQKSQYLDSLIIQNIRPSHILPDMINGLVLLEHISQHLEHGIGLRQIIDWMMFVDKCLDDDHWQIFKKLANNIGLEKLAIITTKMCEKYLGLPHRNWANVDNESLCDSLMKYVMACGNFGYRRTSDDEIAKTVLSYIRRPIAAFKWFQERGLVNWRAAKKHPILKPFAWIYQAGRYAVKGFRQDGSSAAIREEYKEAKERVALFEELGVKQKSKGLVVFRNGQYIKI